jgi:hypothetical protein
VQEAFQILSEDMLQHDRMNELLTYFEHTFIRGRRLRGRGETYGPAFPPSTWNQRNAALDCIARTTNSAEGWHHGLQRLFSCHHPTMWTFLKGLNGNMSKQKATFLQSVAGNVHTTRKAYSDLRDRVARAVANYGQTDILLYINALAHLSHT